VAELLSTFEQAEQAMQKADIKKIWRRGFRLMGLSGAHTSAVG
jgi:hypothetical protein